jgi:hypothetical protein
MAGLESYSNLSKQADDLFKKGFCFSQATAFSIYSKLPQGLNIKSSLKVQNDKSTSASAYFQYKSSQFSVKEDLQSSNTYKTTIEVTPEKLKDVKLKAEVESNTKSLKYTLSAEHSHKLINSKLSLTESSLLKLSSTFKFQDDKGAGLDLALDPSSARLTSYNAALWWNSKKFQAVLRHVSLDKENYRLGEVSLTGLYNLSDSNKLGLVLARAGDQTRLKLGLQHVPENDRVVKVRFDNEATLGVSLRARLNSLFTLVTASQFNLLDNSVAQFGLRLKVNQ